MDKEALIDELAAELGVATEARKKWRQRGKVPYRWRLPIMDLAAERGTNLTSADFQRELRGAS